MIVDSRLVEARIRFGLAAVVRKNRAEQRDAVHALSPLDLRG
ncbi:hypothetical protein O3S80_48890 [Streptomyces sp. Lzd4kr]|nr:hypothetical protein [Streptomyces sp. Lzd4kr]